MAIQSAALVLLLLTPLEAIRMTPEAKQEEKQKKDYDKSLAYQQAELERRNAAVPEAIKAQRQAAEDLATQPGQDFAAAQKQHQKAYDKSVKAVNKAQANVEKQKEDLVAKPDKDAAKAKHREEKKLQAMKEEVKNIKDGNPFADVSENLEAIKEQKQIVKDAPEKAREESQEYHSTKVTESEQALEAAQQDQVLKMQNITAGPPQDFAASLQSHQRALKKATNAVKRSLKHQAQAQQDLITKPMEAYNSRPNKQQQAEKARQHKQQQKEQKEAIKSFYKM